jgi:hypothetical protein
VSAHPVLLQSPGFLNAGRSPAILMRTDANFIDAILAGARTPEGRDQMAQGSVPKKGEDGILRLFQPIHRIFHVAMLDVVCIQPGRPRLDPRSLDGAGLVLRRIGRDAQGRRYEEAWMRGPAGVKGWIRLGEGERRLDPDPKRRRRTSSGNAEIDKLLGRGESEADVAEAVTRLFTAPPDVCADAKETLLYGLVSTASNEAVEEKERVTYDTDEVKAHLPIYLRPHDREVPVPRPGKWVGPGDAGAGDLADYVSFVKQLLIEFDLNGVTPSAERLRKLLAGVTLSYPGDFTGSALDHVNAAVDALVNQVDGSSVQMPLSWPGLDGPTADKFVEEVRSILSGRFHDYVSPRRGRFDDPDDLYVLIGFIRVKRDDGCPSDLVWSEPSPAFHIAPWHESGPVPPVPIQLPPLTLDSVKKLRPNVAFQVPPSIFNFLAKNDPKKLLEGKAEMGPAAPAIQWICGFNIPIITICAFIILFIFLTLLNIVFWWLPFIRICIPIPSSWTKK